MIKIENKTTEINKDKESMMTYADLAIACINMPQEGGYTVEEMRNRIKVSEVLNKAKDIMELEDTDYEVLKQCVQTMKWSVIHKDIVNFTDSINNLTK